MLTVVGSNVIRKRFIKFLHPWLTGLKVASNSTQKMIIYHTKNISIYFIPIITTKFVYYAAFRGCPLIRSYDIPIFDNFIF